MPQMLSSRDSMGMKLCRGLFATSCIVVLLLYATATLRAQAPPATPTADATQSSGNPDANLPATLEQSTGAPRVSSRTSLPSSLAASLSSEQILRLLDSTPGLVVEIKGLIADRMREQGTEIDENSISDQMLYGEIAENASLRARVTAFLRARGYVTDDEIEAGNAASQSFAQRDAVLQQSASPAGMEAASSLSAATSQMTGESLLRNERRDMAVSADPTGTITQREPRSTEWGGSSTDVPQVLRKPAPYNLRSMRDVYTQISDRAAALRRFGSDVFVQRGGSTGSRGVPDSLDVPLGPDFVLGSGDALQIDLWGGVTQSFTRAIGRDGRILLPEAGSVQVAGLTLAHAEQLMEGVLGPQFRNVHVAVTVARLHTVRVFVVGDVQRPGAYEISSLSTPVNALYAAGGPTAVGSLRVAEHWRGARLVESVDLYDFLLHGMRNGSARFESGDTLRVPPAGAQVAITGAAKRPAIYELRGGEDTLAAVIEDSGGLTAAAALDHITIERIDAHKNREVETVPDGGETSFKNFMVRDGDRIFVGTILPYSEQAVYLEGHVARPGKLAFHEGMRLGDVLRSYRDLLPEPAENGEIVRLTGADFHAETIEFHLPDVLIGNANVGLQPLDTIRIFGRYEVDVPRVKVVGEVLRPGEYPMSQGMTAAQLVRMAGGFKRDALLESADLASYEVADGQRVLERVQTVRVGTAVLGRDASADIVLKPGDVLSIHQISGWNDIGESIRIEGQVKYPGSYGFEDGERLSSVLLRAGGLLPTAYPMGAVLIREQVRELEQKSREELIRQIEATAAAARPSPTASGSDASASMQLIKTQQDQALADLRSHPPSGRMVIHISAEIASWANTPEDVELRPKDVLLIPKQPGFVLVTGQVYNATALTFAPGETAGWYLSHAGGTNTAANRREIFVIRANGSVIGRHSGGWLEGDVLSTKLDPGDVVVVPQKIIGTSYLWRNLLSVAQVASSIAITAAVAAQ